MEIGPILRALFQNKIRFWLIVLEVALTLAVVVNCVNMIVDQREKITRPTGMDVDNILVVISKPFAPEFQEDDYVRNSFDEDLRMIRQTPGVRSATAMQQIPLSGGGSATGRRPIDDETEGWTMPYFEVTSDAIASLGVELIEGRDFIESDFPDPDEDPDGKGDEVATDEEPTNIIVTQAMADKMFPDGGALGQLIEDNDEKEQNRIVGIIKHMHGSWPRSNVAERVALIPGHPAGSRRVSYVIRAEPAVVDELYTSLEDQLLALNGGRIVNVRTLKEIKERTYNDLTALNQLLGAVSILLVLVTSLGIIGLTSFSVTQRRRQIGTRRALGATRVAILRYFLVENWLITGAGLTLGVALTQVLNVVLFQLADVPRIGWGTILAVMLLLWVVGLVAALVPALRSTTVSPVVATRTV